MTSVITGDIIKSEQLVDPKLWLKPLKETLIQTGIDKKHWEIFRGDSFQIEVKNIFEAFLITVQIKASLKATHGLDARMSIGIGSKFFEGDNVTESNGKAFQYSGMTLEDLKKEKTNLKIKTSNSIFDKEMNLYFKLALIAMDNWTVNSAETVKLFLELPDKNQEDIAQIIGISQDAVSKRLKRAHLEKILELDLIYRLKLDTLIA